MGAKGQKPTIPEDRVIQEIKEKAYQRGWNERKEFDSGLIEEALRKSQNYENIGCITHFVKGKLFQNYASGENY